MADEQTTVDETTTTTGGTEPQAGKDGQPFDAARAQRTIDQLRDEVKAGKSTARELDAAKAKLKEIDDAGKSEIERATAKATEEEQKRTAAEDRARDLAIRLSVERAARKLNFIDEDDAYRLIDRKAVEMDDDGEPKNVDALLTALAKAKPHLVKAEGESKQPAAQKGTPTTPKPATGGASRDEHLAKTADVVRASGAYPRF